MQTLAQLRSGELQGITRLTLAESLTVFPEEIFNLADTLEILDLSNNCLSSLPEDISRLTKLKSPSSPITALPPSPHSKGANTFIW